MSQETLPAFYFLSTGSIVNYRKALSIINYRKRHWKQSQLISNKNIFRGISEYKIRKYFYSEFSIDII